MHASMRRGGYGDAGGVSLGGLPQAQPIHVQSEDQLKEMVEGIAGSLKPSTEWTQRVDALLRLEGLVLGGAAQRVGFAECLLAVREPLASQVLERRSAVSRQACHVVSVLAEACGNRFEAVAVPLLPVLLKAIAMGIQVVTDSADACARALLHYCNAPRVVPRLCSTVAGDKNGKLRQCASGYLLQVLEEWDPALLDKHCDALGIAILAAAQDAQSDTRAAGRQMYAVYGSTWPAQASAMLHRVDRDKSLQDKLLQALEAYRPGLLPTESSSSLSHQSISRQSSIGHGGTQPSTPRAGGRSAQAQGLLSTGTGAGLGSWPASKQPAVVPRLALSSLTASGSSSPTGSSMPSLPNSARLPPAPVSATPGAVRQQASTARLPRLDVLQETENQRPNGAGSGSSTPRTMQSKPAGTAKGSVGMDAARVQHAGRTAARKSMGGAALRINIAALAQGGEEAADDGGLSAAGGADLHPGNLSARRVTVHHPPLSARASRQSGVPIIPPGLPLTARRVEADQGSTVESSDTSELAAGGNLDDRVPAASLVQLLSQITKAGASWVDKVQLFGMLGEALQGAGSSPHADVAANIDRVAPCLLDGIGDAHFKVAIAALEALAGGLAGRNSKLFESHLDRLMPVLFLRMTDAKEQLKQLAGAALADVPKHHAPDAVLAALAKSLQQNRTPKVKCAVLEYFAAAATGLVDLEEHLELNPGPALRALVGAILHLVLDKNHDIRRAAVRAASVVYHAEQGTTIVASMHSLPPAEGLAVQKALLPSIPSLQSDLAAVLRASRLAPVAGVGNAGSPTASSRRHSGEGLLRLPELPPSLLTARGSSKPPPIALPAGGPWLQGKAAALGSPRLSSPRGASPGRRLGGDGSPAAASPTTSRLGRQASNASGCSSPAEADQQLGKQPSSYITHTLSPIASQPPSGTVLLPHVLLAGRAGTMAGSPQPLSPLGRLPSSGSQAATAAQHSVASAVPHASSMSDLAPFDDIMEGQLRRLLAQLHGGPSPEVFQGLSRLAHVLPGSAWTSHFSQVLTAVLSALDSTSSLLQESGLMLVRDLAAVQPELFVGPLPVLLPKLLEGMVDRSREVVVAADEALQQLLGSLPPQPSLALLIQRLPQKGAHLTADPVAGGLLYSALKNLRRLVPRVVAAGAERVVFPDMLPGLCAAYCSPIADVRKATVDCLVAVWLIMGDALLQHLSPLSTSQMKLLTIYHGKAVAQRV